MISQLSASAAVLVTLTVCLSADYLGAMFGLMAHPDRFRRRHDRPTPQLGGVAILGGFATWAICQMVWAASPPDPLLLSTMLAGLGVGLIGLIDDQRGLSPILRILFLLVFMFVAFTLNPHLVSATLNWATFPPFHIPLWAYMALMAVTTVGLVNSVNMADGQDGLVGSMFVIWTACLMLVSGRDLATVASIIFSLSLVFLAFNFRGKLFLGDCGSFGVTFVIGLLVTMAHTRHKVSLETVIVWFFIPVMDCVRLIISRPLQGRSLFQGGRDHFHHLLIDSLGKRKSAVTYIAVVAVSSLIATLEPRLALVCLCGLSAFYFSFVHLHEMMPMETTLPEAEDQTALDANRVVSIGSVYGANSDDPYKESVIQLRK